MSVFEKLTGRAPGNDVLPFLWVHGEDEATYRKMVNVIHDANMNALCVEARPHPDFCGEGWWKDLGIILDEASKLGMKVWILDDRHFPTGFANGAVKGAPLSLHRRHITHRSISVRAGQKITLKIEKEIRPHDSLSPVGIAMLLFANENQMPKKVGMDELLVCAAYGSGVQKASPAPDRELTYGSASAAAGQKEDVTGGAAGETAADSFTERTGVVDLTSLVSGGKLSWTVPQGITSIEICGLTYDSGYHRSYINMIDPESCRLQIDAVYEPHYQHFGDLFGTVIAGFFSDEPELGNGSYIHHYNTLGTDQTLPYSEPLARRLSETLGADWKAQLPLLWKNDADPSETARVRYLYMDTVTRLVQESFSEQIGDWCRAHGVEYIGHVIEDNNQHARTSTSLGHYYRGLRGQDMAGIDDIGVQVFPGGEDRKEKGVFGYIEDGEFYHYALGKLGSSLAAIEPRKKGRTMCEIFGNYGWSEGVRLERYLLDHFLVRGVNRFVPHAFTCSVYPEKDCPPHFYAQGHNPQYRHFGALMAYLRRMCTLMDGGHAETPIAVLYHGEAEWSGKAMLMQKPARVLADHQIDFLFLPADVFAEREYYHTIIGPEAAQGAAAPEKAAAADGTVFSVNGNPFRLLIIPCSQFITMETAEAILQIRAAAAESAGADCGTDTSDSAAGRAADSAGKVMPEQETVIFLDALPDGLCTGEPLPAGLKDCWVVPLEELAAFLESREKGNCRANRIYALEPSYDRLRVRHYYGDREVFFLVNEGEEDWNGHLWPESGTWLIYNAWDDRLERPAQDEGGLSLEVPAMNSLVLIRLKAGETLTQDGLRPAESLQVAGEGLSGSVRAADPADGEAVPRPEGRGEVIPAAEPLMRPAKRMKLMEGRACEGAALAGAQETLHELTHFKRSACKALEYPDFTGEEEIKEMFSYGQVDPKFSGLIRYETTITVPERALAPEKVPGSAAGSSVRTDPAGEAGTADPAAGKIAGQDCGAAAEQNARKAAGSVVLEVTEAYEGVEVFVDGRSAGIQVAAPFVFDLTPLCQAGTNAVAIEVATTLERERAGGKKRKSAAPTGITGRVYLYIRNN